MNNIEENTGKPVDTHDEDPNRFDNSYPEEPLGIRSQKGSEFINAKNTPSNNIPFDNFPVENSLEENSGYEKIIPNSQGTNRFFNDRKENSIKCNLTQNRFYEGEKLPSNSTNFNSNDRFINENNNFRKSNKFEPIEEEDRNPYGSEDFYNKLDNKPLNANLLESENKNIINYSNTNSHNQTIQRKKSDYNYDNHKSSHDYKHPDSGEFSKEEFTSSERLNSDKKEIKEQKNSSSISSIVLSAIVLSTVIVLSFYFFWFSNKKENLDEIICGGLVSKIDNYNLYELETKNDLKIKLKPLFDKCDLKIQLPKFSKIKSNLYKIRKFTKRYYYEYYVQNENENYDEEVEKDRLIYLDKECSSKRNLENKLKKKLQLDPDDREALNELRSIDFKECYDKMEITGRSLDEEF